MIKNQQSGFTLLEVMIAFAIMVVILAATFLTQGNGLASSSRNKSIIIATNLARNLINEQEVKYDGVPLDRLPEKASENFPEPHKDFKWTVAYDKVDFSALTELISRANAKQAEAKGGAAPQTDSQTETVLKIFKDYLEKSVRRMTVTIEWPDGEGTTSQTFTQLVVNYDAELNVGI